MQSGLRDVQGSTASFLPAIAHDEPDHNLKAKAALASTLVAGLELAREGTLVLGQDEVFSTIELSVQD